MTSLAFSCFLFLSFSFAFLLFLLSHKCARNMIFIQVQRAASLSLRTRGMQLQFLKCTSFLINSLGRRCLSFRQTRRTRIRETERERERDNGTRDNGQMRLCKNLKFQSWKFFLSFDSVATLLPSKFLQICFSQASVVALMEKNAFHLFMSLSRGKNAITQKRSFIIRIVMLHSYATESSNRIVLSFNIFCTSFTAPTAC